MTPGFAPGHVLPIRVQEVKSVSSLRFQDQRSGNICPLSFLGETSSPTDFQANYKRNHSLRADCLDSLWRFVDTMKNLNFIKPLC